MGMISMSRFLNGKIFLPLVLLGALLHTASAMEVNGYRSESGSDNARSGSETEEQLSESQEREARIKWITAKPDVWFAKHGLKPFGAEFEEMNLPEDDIFRNEAEQPQKMRYDRSKDHALGLYWLKVIAAAQKEFALAAGVGRPIIPGAEVLKSLS